MEQEKQDFISSFRHTSRAVHEIAVDKGWWEVDRNDGEMIALMHSELSEALEGLRRGNKESEHIKGFTAVEEELADVVIRIMDYAVSREQDIALAIVKKIEFNSGREYKHGGKKF